jgi:hypothetical protein
MEKQNEISAKRGERVKTKIKSFTDQKKALKVKTPAAKKTAKKKS